MRVFSKIQTKEGTIGHVFLILFVTFFSLFFYCLASLSARVGFVLISSAFLTFVDFWFHTHLHPLHIFDISQLLADFLFFTSVRLQVPAEASTPITMAPLNNK